MINPPSDEEILGAKRALKNNGHFNVILDWMESSRDEAVLALQEPSVLADTNIHYYTTGKLGMLDQLLAEIKYFVDNDGT